MFSVFSVLNPLNRRVIFIQVDYGDEGQVAVELVQVQTVAEDELVGDAEAAIVKRDFDLAARMPQRSGATIIGTRFSTSPDLAAFVNGTTARYVEMNDVYHWPGSSGGHPSDVLTPVLGVGEYVHEMTRALAAITGNVGIPGGWAGGLGLQAPEGGPAAINACAMIWPP